MLKVQSIKSIDRNTIKRKLAFVIISTIIASFFYVYSEHAFDYFTNENDATGVIQMVSSVPVTQNIYADENYVSAITIRFGTNEKSNSGHIKVDLYENNYIIQKWEIDAGTLGDDAYHYFYLDQEHRISHKNKYKIIITDEYSGDNGVSVYIANNQQETTAILGNITFNGAVDLQIGYTNEEYKHRTIAIACTIFVAIFLMILFDINEKLIMTATLISVGFVFFYICPLGMAPDEDFHFFRAFEISCGNLVSAHMGNSGEGGNYLPDALYDFYIPNATIDWNDIKEFHFGNVSLYSPLSYLPQSVGIKIARLFTNNVQYIFYSGRLSNFLTSLILCTFAIWLIPFGNKVIFMAMLFPLTLQEMISLSPDGFVIGLSIFLLSYILHLSYKINRITIKQLIVLSITCIILSQCKIVYIVLLILLLLIPKDKFENKGEYIFTKAIIPIISIILSIAWLTISSGFLVEFQPGVNTAEQIKYVITHLLEFYIISVRTTLTSGPYYIESMFGRYLGALNIPVSEFIIFVLLVLYVYEVASNEELPINTHKYDKYIMLFTFLSCVALIFASLYVQWTPLRNDLINGIQGRYFTPIISLLAFWTMYCKHDRQIKNGNTNSYVTRGTYYYTITITADMIAVLDLISTYIQNGTFR